MKLHRLVGVGAAACVYAAEWEGRQVAVKLMHPTQAHAGAFARWAPAVEWGTWGRAVGPLRCVKSQSIN